MGRGGFHSTLSVAICITQLAGISSHGCPPLTYASYTYRWLLNVQLKELYQYLIYKDSECTAQKYFSKLKVKVFLLIVLAGNVSVSPTSG